MDDTSRRVRNGVNDVTGGPTDHARAEAADDATNVDERAREIRHEIEETRVELTETIDAIQEKLKPRNLVASATDRVKTAATERVRDMADTASQTAQQAMDYTRDMAGDVTDRVRQNPIPLALIGVGAAWLIASRSRRPSYGTNMKRGFSRDYGRDYATEYGSDLTRDDVGYRGQNQNAVFARIRSNPIPSVLAGVGLGWLAFSSSERGTRAYGDRWGNWSRDESWTGGSEVDTGERGVTQKLTDSASQLASSASQLASRTRDYASDASDSMRRMARQRQNQLQRMVQDNPLLVGAGALMLGAAFGLAVPNTDTENEWMGDARDTVVDRARDMARSAANEVQNAASTVADAAGTVADKSQR